MNKSEKQDQYLEDEIIYFRESIKNKSTEELERLRQEYKDEALIAVEEELKLRKESPNYKTARYLNDILNREYRKTNYLLVVGILLFSITLLYILFSGNVFFKKNIRIWEPRILRWKRAGNFSNDLRLLSIENMLKYKPATKGIYKKMNELISENDKVLVFHSYYDSEGIRVRALLTFPKERKNKYPVVIFAHETKDPLKYKLGEKSLEYSKYLSSAGYICITPEYRGYGATPIHRTYTIQPYEFQDIVNIIQSLLMEKIIDKDNIFTAGFSWGAKLALIASMVFPGKIRGFIDFYGFMCGIGDSPEDYAGLLKLHIPKRDIQEVTKYQDPLKAIDKIDFPILILYGDHDKYLPEQITQNFVKTLKKNSKKYQAVLIKGMGHGFFGPDKKKVKKIILDFLEKNRKKE